MFNCFLIFETQILRVYWSSTNDWWMQSWKACIVLGLSFYFSWVGNKFCLNFSAIFKELFSTLQKCFDSHSLTLIQVTQFPYGLYSFQIYWVFWIWSSTLELLHLFIAFQKCVGLQTLTFQPNNIIHIWKLNCYLQCLYQFNVVFMHLILFMNMRPMSIMYDAKHIE